MTNLKIPFGSVGLFLQGCRARTFLSLVLVVVVRVRVHMRHKFGFRHKVDEYGVVVAVRGVPVKGEKVLEATKAVQEL